MILSDHTNTHRFSIPGRDGRLLPRSGFLARLRKRFQGKPAKTEPETITVSMYFDMSDEATIKFLACLSAQKMLPLRSEDLTLDTIPTEVTLKPTGDGQLTADWRLRLEKAERIKL